MLEKRQCHIWTRFSPVLWQQHITWAHMCCIPSLKSYLYRWQTVKDIILVETAKLQLETNTTKDKRVQQEFQHLWVLVTVILKRAILTGKTPPDFLFSQSMVNWLYQLCVAVHASHYYVAIRAMCPPSCFEYVGNDNSSRTWGHTL